MTKNQLLELFPLGDAFEPNRPGARVHDPISAITGAVSAGTSLLGGLFGSNAAKSGGKLINTADQNAAQSTLDTTSGVNTSDLAASTQAGTDVKNQATAGTQIVNDATTKANQGVTDTQGQGAQAVTNSASTGAGQVSDATKTANALLDPYAQSGADANKVLDAGIAPGGQFDSTPTLSQLQMDPGYAFRLQQGSTALDRSAAARGGVTSGGDIKAQTDYAQGSASQEYQNAFNRYETATQNNYANVSGVANRGLTAGTQMGTNDINSATYGSNLNYNAAQYGATTANTAAQWTGQQDINSGEFNTNSLNNAQQYASNMDVNEHNLTGQQTINAGNTANNYRVAGSTAIAQGNMGAANAWSGALNGVGNAALYSGNPYNNSSRGYNGNGTGSYDGTPGIGSGFGHQNAPGSGY
jgi:hypothetical protein